MMRVSRVAGLLVGALGLVGCYTLRPTRGATPQIGEKVAFDLNDNGRAALGGSMGPEIGQIEGRLLQKDTSQYVVAVSAVRLIRGGEQAWGGEQVRIRSDYVSNAYTRQFSTGRTIALSAIGVGAVALIVTQSIVGSGSGDDVTPIDTASTRKSPWRPIPGTAP